MTNEKDRRFESMQKGKLITQNVNERRLIMIHCVQLKPLEKMSKVNEKN
jgi:hypothetical protein